MKLKAYQTKRNFKKTPEPSGDKAPQAKGPLRFVVQMHRATRLHFDVRLEMDGVFRSWAVPKGPSLNPLDQRLAVYVEDHPLEYGKFEGIIPKGNYGAGTVMVWDEGTFEERGSIGKPRSVQESALLKGLEKGHITFVLSGKKLHGEFALIKLKKGEDKAWLMVKKRDDHATYKRGAATENISVLTGRTIDEIAAQAPAKGHIWLSKREPKQAPARSAQNTEAPHKLSLKSLEASGAKGLSLRKAPAESMPRRNQPMMATVGKAAFGDKDWIFEPLGNGHRALAEVEPGRVKLYSKQLLSFEKKYPEICAALSELACRAVFDGEIIFENGRDVYVIFDLLHLDGKNLRACALKDRKQALAHLKISHPCLRVNTFEAGQAKKPKSETLLARDARSAYKAGVSSLWLKIPTTPAGGPSPTLTNLKKVYWPNEGYTKGDLIEYYRAVAPTMLPYLVDRPQSLNRHPEGIEQPGFYQKDMTGYIPRWLKTHRVHSESSRKSIHYALCQDEASLLYLANLGCIEMNPWLSRADSPDHPEVSIIDLDPDGNDFDEVIQVAREVHRVLTAIGIQSAVKTSGATGMHIAIPMGGKYDYKAARDFAEAVCRAVHARLPKLTSLERNPAKRRKRIYLDYMQNARGQTLAAPYCVRPRPGAPVSAPLDWKELKPGLRPELFTIKTLPARLNKVGDLWKPALGPAIDLEACRRRLSKIR